MPEPEVPIKEKGDRREDKIIFLPHPSEAPPEQISGSTSASNATAQQIPLSSSNTSTITTQQIPPSSSNTSTITAQQIPPSSGNTSNITAQQIPPSSGNIRNTTAQQVNLTSNHGTTPFINIQRSTSQANESIPTNENSTRGAHAAVDTLTTGNKTGANTLKADKSRLCVKCRQREATETFFPCGHTVACEVCARSMSTCPKDNKEVTQKLSGRDNSAGIDGLVMSAE